MSESMLDVQLESFNLIEVVRALEHFEEVYDHKPDVCQAHPDDVEGTILFNRVVNGTFVQPSKLVGRCCLRLGPL